MAQDDEAGQSVKGAFVGFQVGLYPKFGGQGMYGHYVHEAVLAAGEKVSGVTIHLADGEYDHGPIVAQCEVPVEANDTVETLSARVLRQEHRFFAATLQQIRLGAIDLDQIARNHGSPSG